MTAPSNANTSGLLELIQARIGQDFDGECRLTDDEAQQVISALVTAASAQARIAELEESDKNGRENWDGIIGPLSTYVSSQDDYDPILDAAPDGGPDVVGQTFIALLEARKDRATAAEARADRLAKGVTSAKLILTPEPGDAPLTEREKNARQHLAALQQETQP